MPKNQKICLYGLSTCVHCQHAKEYLEEKGCKPECIFVDKLSGDERAAIVAKVRELNPRLSFPVIDVNDGLCVIVGFEKEQIDEAMKDEE